MMVPQPMMVQPQPTMMQVSQTTTTQFPNPADQKAPLTPAGICCIVGGAIGLGLCLVSFITTVVSTVAWLFWSGLWLVLPFLFTLLSAVTRKRQLCIAAIICLSISIATDSLCVILVIAVGIVGCTSWYYSCSIEIIVVVLVFIVLILANTIFCLVAAVNWSGALLRWDTAHPNITTTIVNMGGAPQQFYLPPTQQSPMYIQQQQQQQQQPQMYMQPQPQQVVMPMAMPMPMPSQ